MRTLNFVWDTVRYKMYSWGKQSLRRLVGLQGGNNRPWKTEGDVEQVEGGGRKWSSTQSLVAQFGNVFVVVYAGRLLSRTANFCARFKSSTRWIDDPTRDSHLLIVCTSISFRSKVMLQGCVQLSPIEARTRSRSAGRSVARAEYIERARHQSEYASES